MNRMKGSTGLTLAFLFISLLALNLCSGEEGVFDQEIVLGQSCALTGPAEALGRGMQAGLLAYFSKINEQGGIHGCSIRLISRDDGYEPIRAIKNTRALIEEDRVFLLIGEVGTPTSKAVVPIAEENRIPFFGPFTGAEFLRNPPKRYVINVRGSYYGEMETLTHYLVDQEGLTRIACFYQNDGYGQAGLRGLEIALEKRGLRLNATGTYERNTVAVKSGLLKIRKTKPQAVVMVGAYQPCSEFIKLARKVGLDSTLFCNISFVGTEALRNQLGSVGEGCVISQVVNFPWDERVPLVHEYTRDMQRYQPEYEKGFVSLEGYMVAKLFCMALESMEGEVTREKFIDHIERVGTFDLGGVVLTFGPGDHQGMDDIFLTTIRDQAIQPM